ncbi:MAG: DinB family protein [Glaciihabitans sp.]|nr:DinB family protein [Glaciihabitans sp.]
MPIVPDTKDWTWVVDRPCAECGFDAATVQATDVSRLLLENAESWQTELARGEVRLRPDDSTWSALEYACHVRDVMKLYDERVRLMLEEENPLFDNWDQDATAIADSYNTQNPAAVASELQDAATALAATFDGVQSTAWQRVGRRSDGASFTVESISKYFFHDIHHHLWDVREAATAP